jgi:glycosyltransferase involved in cell wall biosynthesis
MTNKAEQMTEQEDPTITIGDTTYLVSDLSDEVKEMLSLHQQAQEMSIHAKRQATIHDLSVENLAARIEKAVKETEESDAEAA